MRESPKAAQLGVGYLATILGLVIVLPAALMIIVPEADFWSSLFRWFVFSAVGLRLLTAGFRQMSQPAFTSREIFHLQSPDAQVIVRELGFANLCLGLTATLSGFIPSWRMAGAFAGGLYLGIAGVMHAVKRPVSPNEWLALVSDFGIFGVVAVCFVRQLS